MGLVKIYKDQILFHFYLNLIVALFISFGSYYHIPLASFKDYAIYSIHFLALQLTLFGFIYLISIQKIIFYSIFPLLYIVGSLFTYWAYTMDITATASLIQIIIETKPDIVLDLISLQLIIYFIIIFIPLYFILKKYSQLKINQAKSPLLVFSIICVLFFFLDGYHFGVLKLSRRLPYSLVYSVIEYSHKKNISISPVKNDLTSSLNNINIVFILGESVRADHLGINGYHRNTTPKL